MNFFIQHQRDPATDIRARQAGPDLRPFVVHGQIDDRLVGRIRSQTSDVGPGLGYHAPGKPRLAVEVIEGVEISYPELDGQFLGAVAPQESAVRRYGGLHIFPAQQRLHGIAIARLDNQVVAVHMDITRKRPFSENACRYAVTFRIILDNGAVPGRSKHRLQASGNCIFGKPLLCLGHHGFLRRLAR